MPAWGRRNGALSLTVQPGMVTDPDDTTRSLGYPFGTVPRLLLTWLSTEAVRTKSQELVLGSSLAEFMRALGLQPSGGRNGTITRLRKQAERLFMATLTMYWDGEDSTAGLRLGVANGYRLWKSDREGQLSFMPSFVRLSGEFLQGSHRTPRAARSRRATSAWRLSAEAGRLLLADVPDELPAAAYGGAVGEPSPAVRVKQRRHRERASSVP